MINGYNCGVINGLINGLINILIYMFKNSLLLIQYSNLKTIYYNIFCCNCYLRKIYIELSIELSVII